MALGRRHQDHVAVSPDPSPSAPGMEVSSRRPRPPVVHSGQSASFFNGGTAGSVQGNSFASFLGDQYVIHMPPSPSSLFAPPLDPRGPYQPNVQEHRVRDANIPMTIQRRTSGSRPARIFGALARFIRRRPQQLEVLPVGAASMERDGFQMYKRHMIPKGLGHPLWIPQANMRLPVPYRQAGVCIGDVGIITREGAFDCLFNICLPLDHPINSSLLPDDFAPLHPALDHQHIIEVREFSSNGYLASNDIYVDQAHLNGINFTTSAPEGAILTMPRGAYVQRLANEKQFDDYIANNAETWYKIANERLRRDAKNGDLRIVLGCHKSTAWGMATFVNRTQYSSSRAQSLRFSAFPPHYSPVTADYFWEASVPVTTKVGPEADDNDGLFDGQFQELRNQCLFVRAPVMTLTDQAWLRISQQSEIRIEQNGQSSSSIRQPDASPRRTGGSLPNPIPSRSLENRGRQNAVIFHSLEKSHSDSILHSQAINDLLLHQNTDARVALTDENDWCRLLRQDEVTPVDSSDLFARIQHINNISKTSNGVIRFELKDQNPDKPPLPLAGDAEANTLLVNLKQGQTTFKEVLLGNLPDFQQIQQTLRLAYILHANGGTDVQRFPPFLTENPTDLFVFDKLLESLQTKDGLTFSPLQTADGPSDVSRRSLLYQALNSTPLPCISRQQYLKTLGDLSWRRYLEFELPADLDETIWLYGKAIALIPPYSVQSLVPAFGLYSALYRRFYVKRDLRDLVYLFRYIKQQDIVDFDDLISQLADHINSPLDNAITPKQPELPSLKLREINTRPPHKRDDISKGTDNIPSPNSTTEGDIDRFAQKFVKSISLSNQQDNSPAKEEGSSSHPDSKFHELDTLTKHWMEQKSPAFSVLWLYGPSAAGMVSHLVQQLPVGGTSSQIASSFTFSDKAAWNNEAHQLFPTIAVDLAYSIPGLSAHYKDVLVKEDSRKLMKEPIELQFRTLVVDPIRRLPSAERTWTIIISGVDKCGYDAARKILTLITEALMVFHLPLRFIITSNRDTRIQDVFNRPSLSKISRQFFVGVQHPDKSPNNDPEVIIKRGFQALCSRNPSLTTLGGKQWPAEGILDTLTKKSHGNPVYANTVVNFLNAGGPDPKASRTNLELVLEPTQPIAQEPPLNAAFAELDSLFTRILSTHPDPNTLVHALGILLVLHDCAQPQTILQNVFGMSPTSFTSVMKVLQSLMHFPKVENDKNIHPWRAVKKNLPNKDERVKSPFLVLALLSLSTTMPTAFTIPLAFRDRVHDSFYDFLVNPERSGRFYIDIPFFHGQMTVGGFALVTHCMWRPSRPDLRRYNTLSPETLDYMKYHLQDHYAQCSEAVREQVLEQLQDAMRAVSHLSRDKTEHGADSTTNTDDFLNNIAILIKMIVNDWDSFGEWSHFADKNRYKDFRHALNAIRDELFPRRNPPRLRRLSGKFTRHDTHHQRDNAAPLFPASVTESAIFLSSVF